MQQVLNLGICKPGITDGLLWRNRLFKINREEREIIMKKKNMKPLCSSIKNFKIENSSKRNLAMKGNTLYKWHFECAS